MIPDQKNKSRPVFDSYAEQERFFRDFYERVRPELEKWERARAKSALESMHHYVF